MTSKNSPDGFGFMPPSKAEIDRRRKQLKNASDNPIARYFPKGVRVLVPRENFSKPQEPVVKEIVEALPTNVRGEFHNTIGMMLAAWPTLETFDACAWIAFDAIVNEGNRHKPNAQTPQPDSWEGGVGISPRRHKVILQGIRALDKASSKESADIFSAGYLNPSATLMAIVSKVALDALWHKAYYHLREQPNARPLRTGGSKSKSAPDPFTMMMRRPLCTTAASVARALLHFGDKINLQPSDMFVCVSEWYLVSATTLKRQHTRAQSQAQTEKDVFEEQLKHLREDRKSMLNSRQQGTRQQARIANTEDRISKVQQALQSELQNERRARMIVEDLFFKHQVIW